MSRFSLDMRGRGRWPARRLRAGTDDDRVDDEDAQR
jgi:hypothetical protein